MVERKENLLIGDSWDDLEIDIPASKYHSSIDFKVRKCPECERVGNKNNDSSLSVNTSKGIANCKRCGTAFAIRRELNVEKKEEKKVFTPPSRANHTQLSAEGIQVFTNRMISQKTVIAQRISESNGDIAFPYMFNGNLVNIKFKKIGEKKYRQSPNGMHVLYNYDRIREFWKTLAKGEKKELIICEGEEETMVWEDATSKVIATSVDNGAPNPKDKIDRKLECLTNCIDLVEEADVVYIAVDNDENGRLLQGELIRRIETDKIRLVEFGSHKDANDFRRFEGLDKTAALLKNCKEIRMEGIFTVDDVRDKLIDMYHNGLPKATTTHMPSVDTCWKWRPTEVTLHTAYGNEGKTTLFACNLPLLKAAFDGDKIALYIPENFPPEVFFEELIHTLIGKTSDKDYPQHRMSEVEFKRGMEFINQHFFFIYPEEAKTTDALFKRVDYLVRKQGIRILILDPLNMIEQIFGKVRDDVAIGDFMTKLKMISVKRNLCTVLIAHQNKPEKKLLNGDFAGNWPEPDPYNIKGGGTLFDKADNVTSSWRPYRLTNPDDSLVIFTSHKIRMKKLVSKTNSANIYFNWRTNRFEDPMIGGGKNPLDLLRSMATDAVVVDDDELPF